MTQIITAIITLLAAWVLTYINKNLKLICISEAVNELTLLAEQTVLELQQTIVDDMKAKGKLSQDEIASLKSTLLARTKRKLSQTSQEILESAKVDINALISGAGEAAIGRSKNEKRN